MATLPTEQLIDEFKKLNEEIREAISKNPRAGPKPITIEEYRLRTSRNTVARQEEVKEVKPKPKSRGGRLVRFKKQQAELHRIINITIDWDQKQRLIKELKQLKKEFANGKNTIQRRDNHLAKCSRINDMDNQQSVAWSSNNINNYSNNNSSRLIYKKNCEKLYKQAN